jgi:hypothetical protein
MRHGKARVTPGLFRFYRFSLRYFLISFIHKILYGARKHLVALQTVTIETFGEDKYGRTIGEMFLEDGRNLNQELVKEGWCWWYRKYAPGNLVLMKLEADAREAKLGLWKDPDPIPPWEFRYGGYQRSFETDPSPALPPPLMLDLPQMHSILYTLWPTSEVANTTGLIVLAMVRLRLTID